MHSGFALTPSLSDLLTPPRVIIPSRAGFTRLIYSPRSFWRVPISHSQSVRRTLRHVSLVWIFLLLLERLRGTVNSGGVIKNFQ